VEIEGVGVREGVTAGVADGVGVTEGEATAEADGEAGPVEPKHHWPYSSSSATQDPDWNDEPA